MKRLKNNEIKKKFINYLKYLKGSKVIFLKKSIFLKINEA
jgi:hypothetical protein